MKNLCGIRPTGKLHIGHYFSVIKPARENDCEILIATFHAPSEDAKAFFNELVQYASVFRIIFQEDVFDARLYFRLLELAPIGELSLMTQYKSGKRNAHLLTYPVLMAHDVAGYDNVYVGEDQRQHLEFARRLLRKYNAAQDNDIVGIPNAQIVGGRVMSLTDPTKKMSKSEPNGCLFLSDAPDVKRKKIRRAVMNEAGEKNIRFLFNEFVGGEYPTGNNAKAKDMLSDALVGLWG